MDTLGRVKMRCWNKLPCSSSTFSFELKRKPISQPLLFVSPPSCSLSMSPKVDEEQSDSTILSTALPESDSMLVHVRFVLRKECMFGERFYLVGDDPLFGLWDPSNGIPLEWSDGHIWSARLEVPMDKKVEFKFVLLCLSGEVHWQPGPNRVLLLDRVTTSTVTVWEDWDSAGNQTISFEDEVPVSLGSSVMQDGIQVPGPDCNGGTSDISNKTGDNPELVEGDVDSGIISNKTGDNPELVEGDVDSGIISNKTGDNPELVEGDVDSGIISNKTGDNPELVEGDVDSGIISNKTGDNPELVEGDVDSGIISNKTGDNPELVEGDVDSGIISNKTGDNPELVEGDVDSGIISSTEQEGSESDGESNSGGMILVPGLNPVKAVTQEDDLIEPLETGDRDHSSVKEITIDDCKDRSYKGKDGASLNNISSEEATLEPTTGASLNNISSEEVTLEPTTAGILRNDLQRGLRALQDFFSSLGFDLNQT